MYFKKKSVKKCSVLLDSNSKTKFCIRNLVLGLLSISTEKLMADLENGLESAQAIK